MILSGMYALHAKASVIEMVTFAISAEAVDAKSLPGGLGDDDDKQGKQAAARILKMVYGDNK